MKSVSIAWALFLVIAGVALGLGGCASSSMSGKVIAGDASVATVVATDEDRMSEAGLEGVDVEVRTGQSRSLIGKATSGADGSFTISIAEPKQVGDRLMVFAKGSGVLPTRGEVYYPGPGRAILVIMRRTTPAGDTPADVKPTHTEK